MTSQDARRETISLGLVHWPLYYGVGRDWARRRIELVITPSPSRHINTETIAKVTAVLRRCDALGVAVGSLPGVRVGVLHCGPGPLIDESGTSCARGENMPAMLSVEPSRLALSIPSMAVDNRSIELVWARLRGALTNKPTDAAEDLGYVDVLEWQGEQFKSAPGRSAANLQLLDAPTEIVAVDGRVSATCERDTVDALIRTAGVLNADPIDVLDAILQRIVPSDDEGPLIARTLDGRALAPLIDVVGRLDLVAPCAAPSVTSETVGQAVAASAERYAEAQRKFSTDNLDSVETTCRRLRLHPRHQPLVAVIRGARLDPIELADGTLLRGNVSGDDGDHFDLTVRFVDGIEPTLVLDARSRHTPIPLDLLEERLRSSLHWIRGSETPLAVLAQVGPCESAWLSDKLRRPAARPQTLGCHERILAHGEYTPDRRALSDAAGTVTYGQLRAAALVTAGRLRRAGVRREDRVAIESDDLAEFVTGCLATLAIGAAFVPIDPFVAGARRSALFESASIRVSLGSREALEASGITRVEWASPRSAPQLDGAATIAPTLPESLAYVMFTSGSTGTPKPVAVEHRALSAYVDAICERLGINSETTVTSPASFTADFGFTALWPALVSGATVAHCPPAVRLDAEAFAEYMSLASVDILKITPSHLSALFANSRPETVLPARTIVFGGERLDGALIAKVRALRPDLRIVNHYGPTETTIGVITSDVTDVSADADVPLGTPLPHVVLSVCDDDGKSMGIGRLGELVVSGLGLARGYLGDPRNTADRFRPAQFGAAGERAYRTGDIAVVEGDGFVGFRGRSDDQVKIRGWRVEPAEVEHALRSHPAVTETAVTIRGSDGEFALVAHAVVGDDEDADGILAYLRDRLPDYLIPEAMHLIARMPLLPNGKVDRGALREMAETRRTAPVLPRTNMERVLAGIWSELMGVEHVDVKSDVFKIGAHSLMATRALARIRELLHTGAMITDVFRHRSVSEFANHLATGADGSDVARRAAVVVRVWDMTDDEVDQALKEGAR